MLTNSTFSMLSIRGVDQVAAIMMPVINRQATADKAKCFQLIAGILFLLWYRLSVVNGCNRYDNWFPNDAGCMLREQLHRDGFEGNWHRGRRLLLSCPFASIVQ